MWAIDRPSRVESSPLLPKGEESQTRTPWNFRGSGLVKLVRVISTVVVVVASLAVIALLAVVATASTADAAVAQIGAKGADAGDDEYVLYALSNQEGFSAQLDHVSTQLEIARRGWNWWLVVDPPELESPVWVSKHLNCSTEAGS